MRATVPARAALAGNPSDLHGGAVLAVPVRAFAVRVEIAPSESTRIVGHDDARALVEAALRRSPHHDGGPVEVRWVTDIPRSVGLAGSSALVIALLEALAARSGAVVEPLALAQLALAIERDDLGIVAGLQDRAVQAARVPVLVDVSGTAPAVTPLAPARPLRLLVAWRDAAAEDSGDHHRRRMAGGGDVDAGMHRLADLAREASAAFADGDASRLARLMGASAAERARIAPLSPAHDELATAVARAGAVPNSAGSGGAVVAVVTDDRVLDALPDQLAPLGAEFVVETFPLP